MGDLFAKMMLAALGITAIAIQAGKAIAADAPCSPWDLAAESDAIGNGLSPKGDKQYWARPCHDEQCRAAKDLMCAYKAMNGRDWPNSMGRGDRSSYTKDLGVYDATIQDLGRTHPDRRLLYCRLLTNVAALDDDWLGHDIEVTRWTTELAARITRPGIDCIGKVMAALPRTAGMEPVVADARGNCEVQKYPLCSRIVQSLPADQGDHPNRSPE